MWQEVEENGIKQFQNLLIENNKHLKNKQIKQQAFILAHKPSGFFLWCGSAFIISAMLSAKSGNWKINNDLTHTFGGWQFGSRS